MKLLVTGAAGMLGRDVMLAAGNAGHDVVGFGRPELDVTDAAALEKKFDLERPDVVINCAAWTDVDGAEIAEEAAFAVNGTGAGNVAAAAAEVGASVVYVSTDYVFDGDKGAPYVESDQPAPLSAYGRTKLAGEEATAAANKRHFVVRSAGLFGIGGPQLRRDDAAARRRPRRGPRRPRPGRLADLHLAPRLRDRAADRGDRVRHPPHGRRRAAAPGTSSRARSSSRPRSSARCSRATTEMLGRPAPRPAFSALTSQREHAIRLPSWQDGLAGYPRPTRSGGMNA